MFLKTSKNGKSTRIIDKTYFEHVDGWWITGFV
jgi:hypothetical protein